MGEEVIVKLESKTYSLQFENQEKITVVLKADGKMDIIGKSGQDFTFRGSDPERVKRLCALFLEACKLSIGT